MNLILTILVMMVEYRTWTTERPFRCRFPDTPLVSLEADPQHLEDPLLGQVDPADPDLLEDLEDLADRADLELILTDYLEDRADLVDRDLEDLEDLVDLAFPSVDLEPVVAVAVAVASGCPRRHGLPVAPLSSDNGFGNYKYGRR